MPGVRPTRCWLCLAWRVLGEAGGTAAMITPAPDRASPVRGPPEEAQLTLSRPDC